MPNLVFPASSTPGLLPGEGEGRLLNAYAEKLGQKLVWRRGPGLRLFADTGLTGLPRGVLDVAGTLYVVYENGLAIFAPGAVAPTNALFFAGPVAAAAGNDPVSLAYNNRTTAGAFTRDIVMVRSAGGAFIITANSIAVYPDGDLPGTVNSVSFLGGYFLFTNPDGRIFASGLNTTAVDALSFATAESRADGLLRGVVWSGEYYALGTETIEIWINQGLSPFPLQRATYTIPIGLLAPHAVAGHEDGWGDAPLFASSDFTVRSFEGAEAPVVSTPPVEAFLTASSASALRAFVYTFRGKRHFVLTSDVATWVYDVSARSWHERRSYGASIWRALASVKSSGQWLVGDRASSALYRIDPTYGVEDGAPGTPALPIAWQVESAPLREFPARGTAPSAFFDFSATAGVSVKIEWSHDGGIAWQDDGEERPLLNGSARYPVRQNQLGEFSHRGLSVRLTVDDVPDFSFQGGFVGADPRAAG